MTNSFVRGVMLGCRFVTYCPVYRKVQVMRPNLSYLSDDSGENNNMRTTEPLPPIPSELWFSGSMAYLINAIDKLTTQCDHLKYNSYPQAFVHRASSIAFRAAGVRTPEMLCILETPGWVSMTNFRYNKDFITFDFSSVEVLNNRPCCSFAGRASNLKEHNDVRDGQSCDPAHKKQLEMDSAEASKGGAGRAQGSG